MIFTWVQLENFGKGIARQISVQIEPFVRVQTQLAEYCVKNGRPPKDGEELAAFARQEGTNVLDLTKFSELRFESGSNQTVTMIWRMAPPLGGGGTNTFSWQTN
jgi:hypothetical protein